MSLRNELRQPLTNFTLYQKTYNWQTWYNYTKQGASAIHGQNPDLLIFLSGMDSSIQFDVLVQGKPLAPSTTPFLKSDFKGYEDKLVLEMHTYNLFPVDNTSTCAERATTLFNNGFSTLTTNKAANQFPLVMSEWGFEQDATTWNTSLYATCLREYLPKQNVGWFVWVMAGSYYIRDGTQGHDEDWGLLNHDWSGWRSEAYVEGGLRGMVNATFEGMKTVEVGGGSGSNSGNGTGAGDGGGVVDGGGGGASPDAGKNAAGISIPGSLGILVWAAIGVAFLMYL